MKNYTDLSEEDLQQLAAQGDSLAEDGLAERYSRLVRICARPYFLAGGDSEDLTQEGMLGLLSAIREYNQALNTSFKTYAELCIRRRLISAVKSASRRKHTPLNEGVSLEDYYSVEDRFSPAYSALAFQRVPEEQVLARERADEFSHTYSRCLSQFEVDVLRHYLDGLSYRAIAQAVGRSEKSVDNAVQRIRRKLARQTNLGEFSNS
jgi:RNA polymerase sporulation-specific sigma factor